MRRVLIKLRGGTPELQVEMGRWRGLRREDRKCAECGSGKVEDVKHFLMRCEAWNRERKELIEKMKSLVAGLNEEEAERRLALILDLACKVSIQRCVEKVWASISNECTRDSSIDVYHAVPFSCMRTQL